MSITNRTVCAPKSLRSISTIFAKPAFFVEYSHDLCRRSRSSHAILVEDYRTAIPISNEKGDAARLETTGFR
jgi:hypothetical protein